MSQADYDALNDYNEVHKAFLTLTNPTLLEMLTSSEKQKLCKILEQVTTH